MSHLQLTLLMSVIVAAASASTRRVPTRERVYAAAYVFLCVALAQTEVPGLKLRSPSSQSSALVT